MLNSQEGSRRHERLLFTTLVCVLFLLLCTHTVYRHSPKNSFSVYKENRTTFDPMQNLDIYVRMTGRKEDLRLFYQQVLVQSLKYFWPFDLSFVVVLDKDYKPDYDFGESLRRKFPFPKICYMRGLPLEGYDSMQVDMFYPEKCTNKTYVGYVDTDAMFTTRVTPDLLFDGNKPIVNAVYGNIANANTMRWPDGTMAIFGTKEVMRCMSYFPVIIKVRHITELRNYIEKLHNESFVKIMPQNKSYSQFNVMCQYLWYFHRNEYSFHFQFNRRSPAVYSPARESIVKYKKILTSEQMKPFPRCAIHYKYTTDWKDVETYKNTLKRGVCFSGGFNLCPKACEEFDRNALHTELFRFTSKIDWSWDKRCIDAQNRHYAQLDNYASRDHSLVIIKACEEIDYLQFTFF